MKPPVIHAPCRRTVPLCGLVVTALWLAGCAGVAGGGLSAETPVLPAGFQSETNGETGASPVALLPMPEGRWWERYGDPATNRMVEQALAANYNLDAAAARILQAQERVAQSRAGFFPSLGLDANAGRSATPPAGSSNPALAAIPGGNDTIYQTRYALGLSAAWQADLFGRIRNTVRGAEANLLAAEADRRALSHTLVTQVIGQRIRLASLARQIALTEETIGNRTQTLELVERRYRLGASETGALDVRLARESLAAARADLPPLQADAAEAVATLSVLLGNAPGTTDISLADPAPFPVGAGPEPLRIPPPVALLDRRPDIAAAAYRVTAAEAGVKVALADLYPDLSIGADYGYQSAAIDNLITPDRIAWSILGNLTAPLFEGGRLRSAVRLREAEVREQAAAYAQTVIEAVRDVDVALASEESLRARIAALTATLDESRAALDLATNRYMRGLVRLTEVLDARRRVYQTEIALTQAAEALWRARLDLMLALGGDWNDEGAVDNDG